MTASGRGRLSSAAGSPVSPESISAAGAAVGEGSAAAVGCGYVALTAVGTGSVSAFSVPQAESSTAASTITEASRNEARFIFIKVLFLLKVLRKIRSFEFTLQQNSVRKPTLFHLITGGRVCLEPKEISCITKKDTAASTGCILYSSVY
jgi:hypothetical protein